MQSRNYSEDLKQIRSIMDRSTRFISLSGLSGVMAGIYALVGAGLAFRIIRNYKILNDGRGSTFRGIYTSSLKESPLFELFTVAAFVLLLAIVTAFLLTKRKAKKNNQNLWGPQTWRLIGNFTSPLIIGGLFTLALLQYGLIGLVAPSMLIFYGLA